MIRTRLALVLLVGLLGPGFGSGLWLGGCSPTKNNGTGGPKDLAVSADSGMSCENTKCQDPSSVCCAGQPCIDLQTNPLNCGTCGKVCDSSEVCSNGMCACRNGGHDDICTAGQHCCSDGCHDTLTDPNNCGGCGIVCQAGETCSMGQCLCGPALLMCSSGQSCCTSGCSDTVNDANNCGKCGHQCQPGNACHNGLCDGECSPACTGTLKCCDSACVNFFNDPHNCGGCGIDCKKKLGLFAICFNKVCQTGTIDGGTGPDDMGMSMPTDL